MAILIPPKLIPKPGYWPWPSCGARAWTDDILHLRLKRPPRPQLTLQECIESCVRSHSICIITARYCTEKGGAHVATAHLAVLLDCAEVVPDDGQLPSPTFAAACRHLQRLRTDLRCLRRGLRSNG
jgi:hypothetical protein